MKNGLYVAKLPVEVIVVGKDGQSHPETETLKITFMVSEEKINILMLTAKNAEGKRIPQELPKAQFQGLMTMMKKGIAAAH